MVDRGGACKVFARRGRAPDLKLTSDAVETEPSDEHAQVQAPPWLQQQVAGSC